MGQTDPTPQKIAQNRVTAARPQPSVKLLFLLIETKGRHIAAMLIISSLERAIDAFDRHKPTRAISLLSEEEEVPVFPGMTDASHMRLYVEQESCAAAISAAAKARAHDLVEFAKNWDGQGNLLIHCKRGVARSTAAALIVLCVMEPDTPEEILLAKIRRAAPHADPCPLFVNYADDILGRNGRMIDAVEDLGPPITVISAPPATIQLAA